MSKHDLGIVIVNYNVRHYLVQCLQSIFNSDIGGLKIEIWVVDNASVDGSAIYIKSNFPQVHLIENQENKGFSVANNQAIRLMSSNYILLLNPDTILQEDTLKKCHYYMTENPNIGALGVRMIDGDGRFLPESKRQIPSLWNSFCKLFYLSELFPKSRIFSGYNLGYLPDNETNEVEVLCGAFMFINKKVLDRVGLLDEAFFMYGEDIDLSHRIIKAGYKIIYFAETSILHFKGESTKKSSINYIRTFYGAMSVYVSKHYHSGISRKFRRFIHAAIAFRALISGVGKFIKVYFRQILDFVLIFCGLIFIKSLWAQFYFNDPAYYNEGPIQYLLLITTAIWVFFLWLFGHYNKKKSLHNTLTGVILGSTVSLSLYALLPEYLRASRAILVLGILWATLVTWIGQKIYQLATKRKRYADDLKNVAIVGSKSNALHLEQIIKNGFKDTENIYFISVEQAEGTSFYHNSLANLDKMIQSLRITDVVFSSDDVSFKEIIHHISQWGSKVRFKIGGDDTLNIIGSEDKNQPNQLFNFNPPYKIGTEDNLRFKRMADVLISIILIPFIPIIVLINGFKFRVLHNIFMVITGQYTWIGYGGKIEDHNFLPTLKKGIIKYPFAQKVLHFSPDYFKTKNIEYAKGFGLVREMMVIWKNLYKIGDKA